MKIDLKRVDALSKEAALLFSAYWGSALKGKKLLRWEQVIPLKVDPERESTQEVTQAVSPW